MASNLFKDAIAKARASKSLDNFVVGSSSKYLPPGTHDVVIQGVDASDADNNKISFVFVGEGDKAHNEKAFITSQQGDLSYQIRAILAACIPSLESLDKFFDELVDHGNTKIFEALTGFKLRVTLSYGKGYQIRATANSKYAAYDTVTDMPVTGEFDTYEGVRGEADSKGLRRAFLKVTAAEATHGQANIQSLEFALAALARKRTGNTNNVTAFVVNT